MEFTRYNGPRRLEETSIDDIPMAEQGAFWARTGQQGQMTEQDADHMYAEWINQQQNFIEPGDYVRSYDFRRDRECYVEGRVTAIEGGRYQIEVVGQVWEGEPVPESECESVVRAPVNGLRRMGGGVTDGVIRIDPPRPDPATAPSKKSMLGL